MRNTSKLTGRLGIKAVLIVLICTAMFLSGCGVKPLHTSRDRKAIKCAKHWKTQGYDFDPKTMTCSEMNEKASAMKRAAYWSQQDYCFDPNSMTAEEMDAEVKAQIFHKLTCCMIWQFSFAQTLQVRNSETY
jgi:hypothetical protein